MSKSNLRHRIEAALEEIRPFLKNDGGDISLIEVKADKQPVGSYGDHLTPFHEHEIPVTKGDRLYLFSDGYFDQFGGDKGKKMKPKAFKNLLVNSYDQTLTAQKELLLTKNSLLNTTSNYTGPISSSLNHADDAALRKEKKKKL